MGKLEEFLNNVTTSILLTSREAHHCKDKTKRKALLDYLEDLEELQLQIIKDINKLKNP